MYASLNAAAGFQQLITQQDYDGARLIAEPLRLYDYCIVNDGAIALILTRSLKANEWFYAVVTGPHWLQPHVKARIRNAADFYFQRAQNDAGELFASGQYVSSRF